MKNFMRRTVAFMLMACLLLSVMAPVSILKADAATTVGNVTTYDFDGTGTIGTSTYKACATTHDPYGEFTYLGKGSTNGYTRVYAEYIQVNAFNDADTSDAAVSEWLALKFTVKDAGEYLVKVDFWNDAPDVRIAEYDSTITYDENDDYVASLPILGTSAELIRYEFSANTDYVIICSPNDATSKNVKFNTISLTKCPDTKAVALDEGVYTYDTAYSDITTSDPTTNTGYVTKVGYEFGGFVHYAQSSYMIQGPTTASTMTVQGDRLSTSSNWLAMKFKVAEGGKYDVTLNAAAGETDNCKALDVFIIPVDGQLVFGSSHTAGTANAANDTYVAALSADSLNEGEYYLDNQAVLVNTLEGADLTAGDYYLILRGKDDASKYVLESMILKPYHVQNADNESETYSSVAKAIEAGKTNLQLIGDIAEDIQGLNGATLDLGGNTIYGKVAVGDGQIVDNAGNGGVVGTVDATGNAWLPLYDGTAYRFFEYTTKGGYLSADKSESGNDEYWFDVDFTDDTAYTLLANTEIDTGIDLSVTLSWTGSETGSRTYVLADYADAVAGWLAGEIGGSDYGMALEVTNVPDGITGVSVAPAVSANGATIAYDTISNA